MKYQWVAKTFFWVNGNVNLNIYEGQMFYCAKDDLPMPEFKYPNEAHLDFYNYWEQLDV